MFLKEEKLFKLFFVAGFFLFLSVQTAGAQSNEASFYIERDFDVSGRSKIEAVQVKESSILHFYIEKSWWESQSHAKKDELLKSLDDLSVEFQNKIYPTLTSIFGYERNPGIDGDSKITILFHPVKGVEVGYVRTSDGYEKIQITTSNEREMVYISAYSLTTPKLKAILAHELVHLITFNQKNINYNIEEDTWLNEARTEFASRILGYDDMSDVSELHSRIKDFIESPSDSITEWRGLKYDYASVSLFIHYLVDHYGVKILSDSLKSRYVGIESINYALEKNGYNERFSDIFTNWTISLILNDCSLGDKYCYLYKDLKSIRLAPNINFLPVSGNASLSVIHSTKNWAGNWQKFIGGNGDLKLDFFTYSDVKFVVPYVLENKEGNYSLKFLNIGTNRRGVVNIPDFKENYKSLIIIPSLQEKFSDFTEQDVTQSYNYSVSVGSGNEDSNQSLIQQLLEQIESLKKQIAELRAKIGNNNPVVGCSSLNINISFGMTNNNEVRCLQNFLKAQGQEIYPEGLITGYFGSLTHKAVIRFQEKYASEILTPLGLSKGTGYVGPLTRIKVNQILSGS